MPDLLSFQRECASLSLSILPLPRLSPVHSGQWEGGTGCSSSLWGCSSRPPHNWTDPWLPGHEHLLTHQAEQHGQGPLPAAHKLKKNQNKTKKKPTTKTVGFLQHRQGHLAVSLHLEICSECLNEEPCPDFEQLSTQSQDARQAKSGCIITHPTEDVSRGHALLQAPTDVRQLWGSRIPSRHGVQPKHSVLQSCRTLGQSPCHGTSSLETDLPCYVLAQLSPIQQHCLLTSKPESQQKKKVQNFLIYISCNKLRICKPPACTCTHTASPALCPQPCSEKGDI